MSKVLILGCGPAGLMAAHAVALHKAHDLIIMSKARQSRMFGAQYLHQPIPIASRKAPFLVTYETRGTPEQYRDKVYGPAFKGDVSPLTLSRSHSAWDIRDAYDWLWGAYGSSVLPVDLAPAGKIEQVLKWADADIVISTVPAPLLCTRGCDFYGQKIWSADEGILWVQDNHVICNGEKNPAWYRAASIQGHITIEWPYDSKPPFPADRLWEVNKPTGNRCICNPQIHRAGRYGKWEKGVLSHTAFYDTSLLLTQPIQERLI